MRLVFVLTILLVVLLPHHGAITVFAPDWARWWKEGILLLLGLIALPQIWKNKSLNFRMPQFWAWLFLLWGGILIALNPDPKTALIAFRYLGLGYVVFLVFSSLSNNHTTERIDDQAKNTVRCFLVSLSLSVLFGIWAHFFGGYEVLTAWYSNTISSWVPGQIIPLYHESDGIIRMQGTASGPIEFSHLLVIGVYLLLFQGFVFKSPRRKTLGVIAHSRILRFTHYLVLALFLLGIYGSHSRGAMIGVGILILAKIIQKFRTQDFRQLRIIVTSSFIGFILAGIMSSVFAPSWVSRAGTSDHITKPIEAIKTGFEKPFTGHLGQWGPAARAKNLAENNDDKAPIAENVFADYFVQLGLPGLLMAIVFFITLWWKYFYNSKVFLITFFVLFNFATILDMTPLSIALFFFLAFLYQRDIYQKE